MKQVCDLVLLVDDDMTDSFIANRIISISGFAKEIVVRNSGSQALMYLIENQNEAERLPDLIFLDINMPVMNGFGFLEAFEKLNHVVKKKCKVIILSSSDSKPDIERILTNDHVIKFMTKPISEEGLEEIHFNKIHRLDE